ncbi:response regulator transcription factor [Algoriphagus halophilus]|uniref:LuxR C-terminal-related transcriptional regulator n=1 Tax=Algoriphagus halophilus TaxID=226505 RepID=UPI00358FF523
MERHLIIGKKTLLIQGLQLILEKKNGFSVDLISLDELKKNDLKSFRNLDFVWIDVIPELNHLLKLSQRILKSQPHLKIFTFGDFKDLRSIKSILKSGINGYFLSNCCPECIFEAIEITKTGKVFVDPKLADIFFEKLIQSQASSPNCGRITKREKQILQLIVEEYTTHEIANKLFISSCTVETHRLHLIQKMGVRNTAGLVREAICANLVD